MLKDKVSQIWSGITARIADRRISSQEIADTLKNNFEGYLNSYPSLKDESALAQIFHETSLELFKSYTPFVDGKLKSRDMVSQIRETYAAMSEVYKRLAQEKGEQGFIAMHLAFVTSKKISRVSDEKLEEALRLARPSLKLLAYRYEREKAKYPGRTQ